MSWNYQGRELTEDEILKYPAFVYLITNKITGRKYIGKKLTTRTGYKTVNGKRKKIRLPSDYMVYYGSNEELKGDVKQLGSENFEREILRFCNNKSESTYYELKYQILHEVLESDNYYNSWIMARVRKSNLKNLNESTRKDT